MSITPKALQNYAKTILDNTEAMAEVRDRFQMRMLKKFRIAAPAERELINAIMDNEKLFFDELNIILGEAKAVNDVPVNK